MRAIAAAVCGALCLVACGEGVVDPSGGVEDSLLTKDAGPDATSDGGPAQPDAESAADAAVPDEGSGATCSDDSTCAGRCVGGHCEPCTAETEALCASGVCAVRGPAAGTCVECEVGHNTSACAEQGLVCVGTSCALCTHSDECKAGYCGKEGLCEPCSEETEGDYCGDGICMVQADSAVGLGVCASGGDTFKPESKGACELCYSNTQCGAGFACMPLDLNAQGDPAQKAGSWLSEGGDSRVGVCLPTAADLGACKDDHAPFSTFIAAGEGGVTSISGEAVGVCALREGIHCLTLARFGDSCVQSAPACELGGLCVAAGGPDAYVCTYACTGDEDCPAASACNGSKGYCEP